jgi:hypothetical protein
MTRAADGRASQPDDAGAAPSIEAGCSRMTPAPAEPARPDAERPASARGIKPAGERGPGASWSSVRAPPVTDVAGPPAPPELEFAVLGARTLRYAASPMLALDLEVTEPGGRQVYMVALTIQLMIEPARRTYDDGTRARLVELFGAPERWSVTTRSLVWAQLDLVVPAFTGSTTVSVPIACSFDQELAAAKYLHSLPDGIAPLALHFNGMIYYRDERGGLQMVLVPWTKSIDFRMPVSVWRDTIDHYYPNTGWVALRTQTLEALQREKLDRGLPTLDACVEALLSETESD